MSTGPAWTPAEDETILRLWPAAPWSEILSSLPGRSRYATQARASIIGARRQRRDRSRDSRNWTSAELEILRTHYPTASRSEIVSLLPGRSLNAIQFRAFRLGLRKIRRSPRPKVVRRERAQPRPAIRQSKSEPRPTRRYVPIRFRTCDRMPHPQRRTAQ